jgi:hypothetical protein
MTVEFNEEVGTLNYCLNHIFEVEYAFLQFTFKYVKMGTVF